MKKEGRRGSDGDRRQRSSVEKKRDLRKWKKSVPDIEEKKIEWSNKNLSS